MSLLFRKGEVRSGHWFGTGADASPSQRVNDDSATRLTSVFAAYRHIVDYCGTLPVDAYRLDSGARKDISLPQLLSRQDEQGGPVW